MDSRKRFNLKPLLLALLVAAGVITLAVSLRRAPNPSPSAAPGLTNTASAPTATELRSAHPTKPPAPAQPPVAGTSILAAAAGGDPALLGKQPNTSKQRAYTRRSLLDPLAMMTQALDLTDEQGKKLAPVIKAQQASIAALRTNVTLSRRERLAKITEMHKTSDDKIRQHLTAEQVEKWENLRNRARTVGQAPGNNSAIPWDSATAPQLQRFGTREQVYAHPWRPELRFQVSALLEVFTRSLNT